MSVKKPCGRCEVLPARPFSKGRLLLSFPLGHSSGKFSRLIEQQGCPIAAEGDAVSVAVDDAQLHRLVGAMKEMFAPNEMRDTKVLLLDDGEAVDSGAWTRVESLERLSGRVSGEWVKRLLAEDRLTSVFHPILSLTDPLEIFAYECLMRGKSPDGVIGPGQILEAARDADIMFFLDRAARITAIREAAKYGVRANLFINFTPTSIYDPAFCLRTTVAEVEKAGMQHEQVIFEVIESDHIADVGQLRKILDFYRDNGFRVALDDLGAGFSSLNLLHQLKPDFVKLDMALIREVHTDPYKAVIAAKLIETAKALDIQVVAEGVEKAGELDWLRRHGADYVQGFYFTKPGSPPPLPDPTRLTTRPA